jgi:uncharacterized protein (TIGR02145 family)
MRSFTRQDGWTLLVLAALCLASAWLSHADAQEAFTDSRDGKTYRTVKIGRQTWMAENLNYKSDSSWCYENADSNCVKYGRLYDWAAAMTSCPSGWHLPTHIEWNHLDEYAGGEKETGKKLKSASGWNNGGNGIDAYGFSALPGGQRLTPDGYFNSNGFNGFWWTATIGGKGAHSRSMYYMYDHVNPGYNYESHGASVRCVKDGK